MNIDQIKTTADIEIYIEGCLNDFETGISTKSETMTNLCELVGHVYVRSFKEKHGISDEELNYNPEQHKGSHN
jgi:hypothetical protein